MFKVIPSNPIETIPKPTAKFPKLMSHKTDPNLIFLFLSEDTSIILQGDCNFGHNYVGKYDDVSHSKYFDDYNLPFTIQNILE